VRRKIPPPPPNCYPSCRKEFQTIAQIKKGLAIAGILFGLAAGSLVALAIVAAIP